MRWIIEFSDLLGPSRAYYRSPLRLFALHLSTESRTNGAASDASGMSLFESSAVVRLGDYQCCPWVVALEMGMTWKGQ